MPAPSRLTKWRKLQWLISVIREVTDAPLSIDSPRPAAVEAGLAMAGKEPFLNSISAESERYATLIPFVKKVLHPRRGAEPGRQRDDR